jgi:hypothetical protein
MRRFFVLALVILVGCGGDSILDPVMTVDGTWNGTANGFQLSLGMSQTDTLVTGNAAANGLAGSGFGTVSGSFKYPDLKVTIQLQGAIPIVYTGTMSQTEAKIFGKMNGSGFENVSMDLTKR